MNAKWMRALSVAVVVALTSTSLVSTAQAQASRLTRTQVEQLLVEARAAIADGNFDRADLLLNKAEASSPRYSLFHLGPTPALVRRELEKAQGNAPPQATKDPFANVAAAGRNQAPRPMDAPLPMDAPSDPFAQRMTALPPGPVGQPIPPTSRDEMSPPVVPALHSHPVGLEDRSVTPAGANPGIAGESQELMPALLPPSQAGSYGTQPVADAAPQNSGASNNDKARVLSLLREARQALVAGDVEQADEAARLATSIGVPESAFLPHEDRPSLLVWDLQRARTSAKAQGAPAARPVAAAALNAPAAAEDRYASQTQLLAEQGTARTLPATTLPTSGNSLPGNNRLAALPEPLDLPPENYEAAQTPLPSSAPAPIAQQVPIAQQSPASYPRIAQAPQSPQAPPAEAVRSQSEAATLLQEGEYALERKDPKTAAALFGQAYVMREELDPAQQVRLQSHMQRLAAENAPAVPAALPTPPQTAGRTSGSSLIDATAADEQTRARQYSAEVGKKQSEARRLRETKPQAAVKLLQETRQQVADSNLSEDYRTQLMRRIDITLDETEKYIKDHSAELVLDEENAAVLAEVERSREVRIKVQEKIAELVNEFNRLRDEQRYPEMEIVARRLIEVAPDEPVAQQVWENSKFIRRTIMNEQVEELREQGNWQMLHDVETSSYANVGDANPMIYDKKKWEEFVKDRKSGERETRRTEREIEIERKLKTPVLLKYEETPLSEVVDGLSELAGINIHLDPRGLSQEGVESSTLITINLSREISSTLR